MVKEATLEQRFLFSVSGSGLGENAGFRKCRGQRWSEDRHEETRTPDLYRVNSEVNNLKSFACLAFPHNTYLKTGQKQHSFGDELVTSLSFGIEYICSSPSWHSVPP